MNCGDAPMSSCRPLKIVITSSPWYFNAFCIRRVQIATGARPLHDRDPQHLKSTEIAYAPGHPGAIDQLAD